MYDAFWSECLRMNSSIVFNGDESRRGSTHHVHGRISAKVIRQRFLNLLVFVTHLTYLNHPFDT